MTLATIPKPIPVAVLGRGSGGHAMAFYLASLGCKVTWWVSDPTDAATISKSGTVTAIGAFSGAVKIDLVSDDLPSVLSDVGLIFVVVPSSGHDAIAKKIAPHLVGNETLILCPGRTGGAVCFKRALDRFTHFQNLTVGETQSLIFTCRKIKAGFVDFMKFKDFGQIAFIGPLRKEIKELLDTAFPQMKIERSTLTTSLANYGAMLHPAPVLFNLARIEDPAAPFAHFYKGITPTIARFVEKMDQERIQLAEIFGLEAVSTLKWHELCYGVGGNDLFEALCVNERYASLAAPTDLTHRYIHEDIPTGLVPLIALADAVSHPVPCMKAVLEITNLVLDREIVGPGRSAESMGIADGSSIEQILRVFNGTAESQDEAS